MAEIVQVLNGEGHFEQDSVQQFVAENDLAGCKTNYQVVAIMGPQSSGKSTLLNHVFGTNFAMMDAMAGRGQTTKGIWMSKSPKVTETTVLVMDLEGSDGRERGEDDTNFERQSALFALAVADVLLVNIWCHDIGREHGSGKPLLKTIFQVNLKLFAPEPDRERTVLLFVIRDKTKTPLPKLVEVLEADLDKMWDSIAKPKNYQDSKLTDFFEVKYAALSNYEERFEDFQADAVHLRRRFSPEGDDPLIREHPGKLPGDSFAMSIGNIWDVIRAQKDLNLPAHKVMVANVRCQEIMEDQLRAFSEDQAWAALREESGAGIVEEFGKRAFGLMDSCIKGYQAEALYFDAHVREAKLAELQQRLLAALQPVYQGQVAAQQAAVMAVFERDLKLAVVEAGKGAGAAGGEGADFVAQAAGYREQAVRAFAAAYAKHLRIEDTPWDGVAEQQALEEALDAHVARVRGEQVQAALARAEKQLAALLSGPVIALLEVCPQGMWPRLYAACGEAAGSADKSLKQSLHGFGLSGPEAEGLTQRLRDKAREAMEGHVREAALTRLSRMKDRFQEVFSQDPETKAPRMWGARDDVPAIAGRARLAAATVLAQLAVIRPADGAGQEQGDLVDSAVLQLARTASSPSPNNTTSNTASSSNTTTDASSTGGQDRPTTSSSTTATTSSSSSSTSAPGGGVDMLSASTWPGVDEAQVLLQPHDVRTTWREFMSYSNVLVQQALSAQQANRLAGNRMPPLWALLMMVLLGWNEAMTLLFNPLYLIIIGVVALFARSLYTELDVEREMAAGALPGAISLSRKFVPAFHSVIHKTRAALQNVLEKMRDSPLPLPSPDQRAASYKVADGPHERGQGQGQGSVEMLRRRPAAGAPGAPDLSEIQPDGKKDR